MSSTNSSVSRTDGSISAASRSMPQQHQRKDQRDRVEAAGDGVGNAVVGDTSAGSRASSTTRCHSGRTWRAVVAPDDWIGRTGGKAVTRVEVLLVQRQFNAPWPKRHCDVGRWRP